MSEKKTYHRAERALSGVRHPGGVMGFMSYERLCGLLQASGECSPSERVTHLTFDEKGMSYRVEMKEPKP